MNHDNHENPISIFTGSILAIGSWLWNNDFIITFGLDLFKVCLFGFVGGVFGLMGKRAYMAVFNKNKNHHDEI